MKKEALHDHHPVETESEEGAMNAAMLAPLEEQESMPGGAHQQQRHNRAMRFDTAELKLPKDFIEEDKERGFPGLEPIAIFILFIVLAFIGIIAYLISIEPA